MILTLLACERFRKGEKAYATATGMWKLCSFGVPEHAFLVQAGTEIGLGRHGRFLNLNRRSHKSGCRQMASAPACRHGDNVLPGQDRLRVRARWRESATPVLHHSAVLVY